VKRFFQFTLIHFDYAYKFSWGCSIWRKMRNGLPYMQNFKGSGIDPDLASCVSLIIKLFGSVNYSQLSILKQTQNLKLK
jgi:hypothetical protein